VRLHVCGVLLAALVIAAGCTPESNAPHESARTGSTPARSIPATMPDLVGTSLEKAGTQLRRAGLEVTVVLPEREFFADDQGRAERGRDGRARQLTLPEQRVDFGSKPGWAQLVAAQEPDAGTVLGPTSAIVLEAGKHTGGDPSRPWVWGHVEAVKRNGATPCFERCHAETSCSDCHVEMLPD